MQSQEQKPGVTYRVTDRPLSLYGIYFDEKTDMFRRMPRDTAAEISDGVLAHSDHTSGGRVCFSTDAATLTLRAVWDALPRMNNMPLSGSAGFVLCEQTEAGESLLAALIPGYDEEHGMTRECALRSGMRDYILYFPLYNRVRQVDLTFPAGAQVGPGRAYQPVLPVLYYGSSITQGGCASRANNAYEALIAKRTGVDFINLGFSGSARGEDAMADYLATVDCSLFVLDYDHNVGTQQLQENHARFFSRYRAVRPETPVLMVSRPDTDSNPADSDRRFSIIRNTWEQARAAGDRHVYLIDGRTLFGTCDRENCTSDTVHPNDLGFWRMAEVIGRAVDEILAETVPHYRSARQ